MNNINQKIDHIYEEFQGFPAKKPIVRFNTKDDAFVILVFEILLRSYHGVSNFKRNNPDHHDLLTSYIVPPPDDSIDIFYEEKNVDDCKYHVIQVKNAVLTQDDIENCFLRMEHTVRTFLSKPKDVKHNLRDIISESTEFNRLSKNNITYYVVHKGNENFVRNKKDNYVIITGNELSILDRGINQMCVPEEKFIIDSTNNFIVNNFVEGKDVSTNKNLPASILCNFNGYDLAVLNNKYHNTFIGRNILYGENLRESLNKKTSKTFEKMFDTIDKEPEMFLFYNNGITIISSDFDSKKNQKTSDEVVTLKDFSIINGAQTTSTLGAYLKAARNNGELDKIDKLKKVFVLTKIYKIDKSLNNHEIISENIKIFNNTQTPLSSRDMVSIRREQNILKDRFLGCSAPNIYINIKKGVEIPPTPLTYPHQRTNNETLAQLILSGILVQPFTAKDKKTKIFDYEANDKNSLNEVYFKLFDESEGELFKRSNLEIDELLFIYRLHEDTKKFYKGFLKEQLNGVNQNPPRDAVDKESKDNEIDKLKRNLEIINICLFFNLATYYKIKYNFGKYAKDERSKIFDYSKYYGDKDYKSAIIKRFQQLFYKKTVEIIRKKSGTDNITNWLRLEKNETIFLDGLTEIFADDGISIKEEYPKFVSDFKIDFIEK